MLVVAGFPEVEMAVSWRFPENMVVLAGRFFETYLELSEERYACFGYRSRGSHRMVRV